MAFNHLSCFLPPQLLFKYWPCMEPLHLIMPSCFCLQLLYEKNKITKRTETIINNTPILKDALKSGDEFWDGPKTLTSLMEGDYFVDESKTDRQVKLPDVFNKLVCDGEYCSNFEQAAIWYLEGDWKIEEYTRNLFSWSHGIQQLFSLCVHMHLWTSESNVFLLSINIRIKFLNLLAPPWNKIATPFRRSDSRLINLIIIENVQTCNFSYNCSYSDSLNIYFPWLIMK